MRTCTSGWLRRALLTCNAQETGASGVVAKTSAIPSPVGRRVSLPVASAAQKASVSRTISLLIDQQFRVTNDVDEEDMGDLQPNLFFNLGGHVVKLRENRAIDNSA